jgi:two-component system invasion response regulator UvrY
MLNVMLIDSHDLIRSGIKYILKDVKNIQIISESVNCEEAISLAQETMPDVAIISLNKFEVSFLDGIQKLMRRIKHLRFLILTDCMNEVILSYLLKSGVQGCLSMNADKEEIIQALKAIKNGERFVSSDIANFLATSTVAGDKQSPFKKLSSRELQVVLMIIRGLSPKEIAEKLFLSSKTISTYRNNIFNKLEVKNEVEMTLLAIMSGLLEVK